ncbi:8415_t:CDS:2 [Funneliformis geosporum]|uniref:8415_t:CDS:1 n=1 Tax=Funneliformis geosporum TaxID=1117311 RepID=A0A9W4WJM5_9GLOM|nr:8415_t:CDS:2 [Funneliformis geosporum]
MESSGNPKKQEENVNEKADSDSNAFNSPSKNQPPNNENSLEQSTSQPINNKNSKDENKIKVIFHAHFPENTFKIGHPVIFGDGKELGSWEHPNIKLQQPFPQIPTYWQSNPVNISLSNIAEGHVIQYRYAIHTMEGKIVFEGDNRILDTARNDQFGIWKNTQALRISLEKIQDFTFVNYIYNSINADNLKDKVMQFQHLLANHEDLTIRNHIQRQTMPYELSNEFPSELLLDALEGYKQDILPLDTRDQMCIAITALVHHNAFQMHFNWLKVFKIAAKVDPKYTFIDRLRALMYPNDSLLETFVKGAEIIRPYIDGIDFEAYVKLAKALSHLWSGVLLHNAEFDRNIFKCFANRVQVNISDDDAIALDAHFKGLPQSCRSEVSGVFRDHALLLLKNPSSKWTDQNIFAIRKLLQDVNLNWNGDDVILALELISKSNDFGLLGIFPELLDGWFRKDFSDPKNRIQNICVNWFTLFLIKLSTNNQYAPNEGAFVFLVFQQLERMHPLLGQRINIWRDITKIAIKRVKKCSEAQIFTATKLVVHLKRDEFKNLFVELVKKVLSKTVQNIDDQLIDKLLVICNCVDKTKPLLVPNLMCEEILCHVMIKLQNKSIASSRSEHHLNTLNDRKFWNVILCATGSVENLNLNSYVKHIKASIYELGKLLIERTIDIKSLQQILKYSDEELFKHLNATSGVVISLDEIVRVRELCHNFQLQSDILFKFYERFCSTAQDVNVYLQQIQSSDRANLRQGLTADYWLFHEKTINSAKLCYKFNQSQTFQNIFEICLQEDAAAKKVEYIANTLMPTVFKKYNAFCVQFREWEKIKCSDASLFWKNVTNFNVELDLMGGNETLRDNSFVQSLDHVSKIPQWIERLERLDKVAYIFNIPRDTDDWLSKFIRILKDDSRMLGQINNFFDYLYSNLSRVNNDCWKLISELSDADDFMSFLKEIAQHDITNLINVIDENADEKLVKEEETASSLIQVKQFLFPLMDKNNMETVADILDALSLIIKKNSTLRERIILCKSSNMALQNMYNSISTRGKITKEKIKNAVNNGIYTFKRDEKEEKCTVTLVFTSKTEIIYNLNEILDLRGRALLIVKTIINDKDMELPKNVADDFITQVDTAQEIISVVSALIQTGHFDYQSFEKKLRGTISMKKFLKYSKDELKKWEDIVNNAQKGCYYLTFFPARHILTFYAYFISEKQLDNDNEEKCRTLIRSINSKVQLPSRKDYLEILCEIGDGLKRIFRNVPKQTREFTITKQLIMSDIVTKGKLFVAACTDKSRVPNIIMSLYANHGFYPEPWQLLICTSTTTPEELSIFIKRSFFASNNGYENHLFCIANLEELEIELQFILIDQIRILRESYNQYLLALICCKETEMYNYILDQSSLEVHSTNGLDTEEMREIYQELCQNVICVTSDLSGQGKTEWIKETSLIKNQVPRGFLIRDGMDFGTLLHQFKECKLRPEESLHINIVTSDHPEDVNMFLFELLTLDIASSNIDSACISSSETPTCIFIEVASTSQQRLLNSLPMTRYLLSKHLTWNIENLRISQQINSPIQITCHYLNLYDHNEIDAKEILLRNDAIKKPISVERCRNLIEKYFFHENSSDVSSFRFVEIFVNVLAEQLVQLSTSQFFSVDNLKLMMIKEANIGSLIVGTLMVVSKDLAIRSIQMKASQLESLNSENVRLGTIAHWDDSDKLMVFFNSKIPYLLYRDSSKVHDSVKTLFKSQVIGDRTEWELDDINAIPANAIFAILEELAQSSTEKLKLPEYALSRDNLIKMALILFRAHANIPVIVCGEAGCGKTSLIAYLAILSGVQFQALNLHAGINEGTIMTFIDDALKKAEKGEIWLLFDEINTCNHMGLLADLISRRIFNGKPIHSNIRLFSACNPYRLRTSAQSVTGLTNKPKKYEQHGNLVYQVKPLPDQILDYVWDYGILKSDDECKYIQTLVERELKDLAHPVFIELLFASQKFIRKVEEPYSVSLRDVKRAITLMKFFYNSLENRPPLRKGLKYPPPGNPTITTRSYILAISLCYHSRLCDHEMRKQYRHEMEQILQNHKVYEGENMFSRITREEQEDYINRMKCPPNTAKNEALLENILSLIACILTRIPLFLIGASGLAEKSPFNPLKVLHSLLEPSYPAKGPNVSVIGVSNWRLDNSKSNRALLVHRY